MTKSNISQKDRQTLRELALQVAELSAGSIQAEKRDLWYRHNALQATRPLIFCDPENGWNEIITRDQLQCEGTLPRQWEYHLRREIFWGNCMGDDRVIEPYFDIGHIFDRSDWGMEAIKVGGNDGGSYHWDAPLKNYENFYKLRFPKISIRKEATQDMVELAGETLGDLLPVRLKSSWWWTLGLTQDLVFIRGLEQMMYDMYDYPDELHRLMGFLRDAHLDMLDFLEQNRLLSLNNDGTYVGSGGFGYIRELPQKDFDGTCVRTMDMWGFSESQETSEVSPDMFEEFIFPYQLPLLERFGLNCYGCCEALDKRWHIVKRLPRLRRISVSPWANLGNMAEQLGADYIYSMKPSPSDLAVSNMDEEFVRRKLREAIRTTRNCRVEIIMKDNHTIGRNPQNVINWCRIAKEEADRI
jgi:hypothetical protein